MRDFLRQSTPTLRWMIMLHAGIPNAIRRLAEANLKATLAVSLHAPNQALREQLVPSAKVYPLAALMSDCAHYWRASGRRVTFEYTLLQGLNDELTHVSMAVGAPSMLQL